MEPVFVFKFSGKNDLFSNSYPLEFDYNRYTYNCGEQGFMHQKAIFFKDYRKAKEILDTPYNPIEYRNLGRSVSNYNDREWSNVKYDIMINLIKARCEHHYEYKMSLIGLRDYIIAFSSPTDIIWGIGYSKDDPKSDNLSEWRGRNLLGNAYMEVRDLLIYEME